ncbi:short-chain dehydrogenase [Klebsiella quasipneumoniae]|uniref:short-chain dehydrogenase n=1 Tax=Klebsiella quasipneumoniae TaxID=1463165 RepID=UPI003D0838EB
MPCNVAPLQNQDKTAAMSIDRREIIPVIRNAYVICYPERRIGREGESGITAPDYSPG